MSKHRYQEYIDEEVLDDKNIDRIRLSVRYKDGTEIICISYGDD